MLIFYHFNSNYCIWIKIDAFDHSNNKILNPLTLDNSKYYHLIVFFFIKIIFVKTHYKTYNSQLLASVKFLYT